MPNERWFEQHEPPTKDHCSNQYGWWLKTKTHTYEQELNSKKTARSNWTYLRIYECFCVELQWYTRIRPKYHSTSSQY